MFDVIVKPVWQGKAEFLSSPSRQAVYAVRRPSTKQQSARVDPAVTLLVFANESADRIVDRVDVVVVDHYIVYPSPSVLHGYFGLERRLRQQ